MPAVALLGLLAALLAHAGSYGDDHVAGGAYHRLFELLGIGGAGGFALAVVAIASLGARRHVDGSVLAAAMRPLTPTFLPLMASATSWFIAIESVEPEHHFHAALVLVAICLAAASLLIVALTQWFLQAVAAIVFAIAPTPFDRRPVTYRRRFAHRSSARRISIVYRRFGRAPPRLTLIPV